MMTPQDAPKDTPCFDTLPMTDFSGNHMSKEHPRWPKLEKEAMAALIGVQWRHVETIFTNLSF